MLREGGGKEVVGNEGGETVLNNIFKNGFIFLKYTDCRDFFRKLYGLYGFLLKMYGFLYGFFQKSFDHPVKIVTCYKVQRQ